MRDQENTDISTDAKAPRRKALLLFLHDDGEERKFKEEFFSLLRREKREIKTNTKDDKANKTI